jgi:hypothetical protein
MKRRVPTVAVILGIFLIQLIDVLLRVSGVLEIPPDVNLLIMGAMVLYIFGFDAKRLVLFSVGLLSLVPFILIVNVSYLANLVAALAYLILLVVTVLKICFFVSGRVESVE